MPQAFRWFDMQDLSCLIAPRKLAIIAGKYDTAFLIDGVKRGYKTVEKIYEKAGAKDNCRLVITEKGHWWCEDIVWKAISANFPQGCQPPAAAGADGFCPTDWDSLSGP